MADIAITREDLKPTLDAHHGNEALLNLVCRYIQFNGAFGPGLANLSGEIAACQGLFRDRAEPVEVIADRAAEVASDFFHAAVDEYDDRATPWRDTHRTLAQACLKGMAAYYGYEAQRLNEILVVNKSTHDAMARVFEGYGIGAKLEDQRLFAGMGFHAGSEVLADQEFTIIDKVLRERLPEMVKALTDMRVRVGSAPEQHKAYYWISIHTSVEADHFDSAVQGVNKALSYYVGKNDPQTLKDWILRGFADFARVQADFMAGLSSSS